MVESAVGGGEATIDASRFEVVFQAGLTDQRGEFWQTANTGPDVEDGAAGLGLGGKRKAQEQGGGGRKLATAGDGEVSSRAGGRPLHQ